VPKVYNKRFAYPEGAVHIDRPSPWGNPWSIGKLSRREVLDKYREYAIKRLEEEPYWLEPLQGKDLVCWCHPMSCHGDILLELIDGY